MQELPSPTSLPALVWSSFRCWPSQRVWKDVSWSFYFQSFDCKWCWASFHLLIGYSYVVFSETCILVFCPFLNTVVSLFFSSFVGILCIFHVQDICQINELWIFSPVYVTLVVFRAPQMTPACSQGWDHWPSAFFVLFLEGQSWGPVWRLGIKSPGFDLPRTLAYHVTLGRSLKMT